jgi:N-acetylmuramoyl-L-alanine amidase
MPNLEATTGSGRMDRRGRRLLAAVVGVALAAVAITILYRGLRVGARQGRGPIHYRAISFGTLRKSLTLQYIRRHYDPHATTITIAPRMIVLHWTASSSLESALAEFEPETIEPARARLRQAGEVNVSAQFLVDRDGRIYQLMPVDWMARHTVGLNRVAIGIENVGGPQWPLTQAQVEADAWLVRRLVRRFPGIEYLIGHYEYLNFRATPLWQEREANYASVKIDPGPEFMQSVRGLVGSLKLKDRYLPGASDSAAD